MENKKGAAHGVRRPIEANTLLDIICQVQAEDNAKIDTPTLFDRLLHHLLSLTESEYGFIGDILHTANGTPYLKTHAITNFTWDEEKRRFYENNAPQGMEFYNLETLFGAVITTGEPVFSNTPTSDPRRGGLPEGHPALHAFMGLPLYSGTSLIGMVGLANRPAGYDESLAAYLKPLLATCANIISAHRSNIGRAQAEEQLRRLNAELEQREHIHTTELEETHRTNQALLDAIADFIFQVSRDGTILNYKASRPEDLSLAPDQFLGKTIPEVYPDALSAKIMHHVVEAIDHGHLQVFEFQIPALDGSLHDYEARIVSAGVEEALIIVRDITERKQAEAALRRSEERLRTVVSNTPVVLFALDQEGLFTVSEGKGLAQLGLEPGQVVGLSAFDVYAVNDAIVTHLRRVLDGEECAWTAHIGELVYDVRALPLLDEKEEVTGCIGIATDITQQKQAEQARHQVEGQYRQLVELAQQGIWVIDQDANTTSVNESMALMLGYTPEEMQGKHLFSFMDEQAEALAKNNLERREQGITEQHEFEFLRKDGKRIYTLIETAPIRDEEGVYQGAIAGIVNISERKRAEEALRKSEEKWRSLVEDAPDDIVIVDRNALIQYINHVAPGLELDQVLGKTTIYNYVEPDSHDAVRDAIEQVFLTGQPAQYESYSPFMSAWYSTHVGAIRQGGKVVSVLMMSRDITRKKQVEQEREVLIAELEAKKDELERYAYTVSHDLKSPLVTIKGFLGFLEQDIAAGETERWKQDITRINAAANKMERLLNDVLEHSRIGRQTNPSEAVQLTDLAREAAELVAGRIDAHGVTVVIDPAMPVVYGDWVRLLEVYQNLIDNATKFMGSQAAPHIEVGARQDGAEVVCHVRDNGIGIAPQNQETVFNLFERIDTSSEGTGVGLALVKRIVDVHGGRIWAESEGEGQGTTFFFTLPAME